MRNLEVARQIVKEATGLDITYAYDDLVFPDHTAFLIQFDDTNEKNLICYFRTDCPPEEKAEIYTDLSRSASDLDFTIAHKGTFELMQKDENVEIRFNN